MRSAPGARTVAGQVVRRSGIVIMCIKAAGSEALQEGVRPVPPVRHVRRVEGSLHAAVDEKEVLVWAARQGSGGSIEGRCLAAVETTQCGHITAAAVRTNKHLTDQLAVARPKHASMARCQDYQHAELAQESRPTLSPRRGRVCRKA